MKICETYSHLNGLEFLLVHKPKLWEEIQGVIASVDAEKCKTKISKEKTMRGKVLYSPVAMNAAFKKLLKKRKWEESRVSYWVTRSEKLIRKTLSMSAKQQKEEIEAAGETPIFSYNQTALTRSCESLPRFAWISVTPAGATSSSSGWITPKAHGCSTSPSIWAFTAATPNPGRRLKPTCG